MMKRKINIINCLLIAFSTWIAGACSDYFDVRPKSQVLAETLFEDEAGFNDQLIGVYKRLASTSLYSKEMNFGLMEVLGQNYDLPIGSPYEEAALYNYKHSETQSIINGIWGEMYTAIANLNILLEYIDANKAVFTDNNYALYKGEALGLRAFLHFELLRIFAPAYTKNSSAKAIPYVKEYTTQVTPQSTVKGVVDLAVQDLKDAMALLEIDPLYTAGSDVAYTFRDTRSYRFNYYAAVGTLARLYLWSNNLPEALKYAQIVINSTEDYKFSWVHYTSITSGNAYERDLLFGSELLFRINVVDMDDAIEPYFHAGNATQKLSPNQERWDDIYELDMGYGQDWRHTYHWSADGGEFYLAKYWQYENGSYKNFMPVIRLTEMYYIAAEACRNSNPAQAVKYLNVVRENRYLSDFALSETLSAEEIQNEIYKEYRKEFMGEGQLFFYYKRLNYTQIPGSGIAANDNVYVLPMPDNEIEFGNRQ